MGYLFISDQLVILVQEKKGWDPGVVKTESEITFF